MNMSIANAMKEPAVKRLVQEGFDAFRSGASAESSPYRPSHENYWWHQGYAIGACVAHLDNNSRT